MEKSNINKIIHKMKLKKIYMSALGQHTEHVTPI